MNKSSRHWSFIGRIGLLGQAMTLLVTIALCVAIAAGFGLLLGGERVWLTAAVAGAVCLAGGWIALALLAIFPKPHTAIYAVLGGMLVRLGLPLAVALAVHRADNELNRSGFSYYLLGIYPAALLVETIFVVSNLQGVADIGSHT